MLKINISICAALFLLSSCVKSYTCTCSRIVYDTSANPDSILTAPTVISEGKILKKDKESCASSSRVDTFSNTKAVVECSIK